MKKNVSFIALILTMVMLCVGCGQTDTPKTTSAPETQKETESVEMTETETETVIETTAETAEVITEVFNPVTEITDTMWVAYEYTNNNGYPMYLINFRSDGTMHYSAGWVKSEIAFSGEGTWTSSDNQITYDVSGDGYTFSGTLEFVLVAGDTLALSHVSGDPLNYLMESGPLEFVVQGSSMDNPPI